MMYRIHRGEFRFPLGRPIPYANDYHDGRWHPVEQTVVVVRPGYAPPRQGSYTGAVRASDIEAAAKLAGVEHDAYHIRRTVADLWSLGPRHGVARSTRYGEIYVGGQVFHVLCMHGWDGEAVVLSSTDYPAPTREDHGHHPLPGERGFRSV